MKTWLSRFVVVALAALVIVGCSSSSHDTVGNGGTTTPSGPHFENEAAEACYRKLEGGAKIDDCQTKVPASVTIPNVVGMRVCDALPVLVKAGAVPETTPASKLTWIVKREHPAAGKPVKPGVPEALALEPDQEATRLLSPICEDAVAMTANGP